MGDAEDRDWQRVQYQVLADRRAAYDSMIWQAPALSFTAEAFLFVIALNPSTPPIYRLVAAVLSLVVVVLSAQLMLKHRYNEAIDERTLWALEHDLGLLPVHSRPPERVSRLQAREAEWHGGEPVPGDRFPPFSPFSRYSSTRLWLAGLVVFGVAAWGLLLQSIEELSSAWTRYQLSAVPSLGGSLPTLAFVLASAVLAVVILTASVRPRIAARPEVPPGWVAEAEWLRVQELVPIACVDLVLLDPSAPPQRPRVGLVLRPVEGGGLRWCLVGGRIRSPETVAEAAARHLRSTLGPGVRIPGASLTRPVVGEYFQSPRPGFMVDLRKRAIALTYVVPLEGDPIAQGVVHEAKEFRWFDLDGLPAGEMGFGQGEVLNRSLKTLGLPAS